MNLRHSLIPLPLNCKPNCDASTYCNWGLEGLDRHWKMDRRRLDYDEDF